MNRFENLSRTRNPLLMALLAAAFVAGCGGGGGGSATAPAAGTTAAVAPGAAGTPGASITNPTVNSSNPSDGATNVPVSTKGTGNVVTGKQLTATFNEPMNDATVNLLGTFTLKVTGGADVPGIVTMNAAKTVATFTPNDPALIADTSYTATITTAARTALPANTPITNTVSWSFRTKAGAQTFSQLPVELGRAGTFAIFSNTAVTSVFQSDIRGNVGTAGGGAGTTVACAEVTVGGVFDTDAGYADAACLTTDPVFVGLTAGDMAAAISDAKGRSIPDFVGLGAGNISGMTLTPGLYKWGTGVLIDLTGITITGGANDVWIFQISGDLTVQNGAIVTLGGAAQARNIFWQVGGGTGVALGTTVEFKGIIMADAGITLDGGVGTSAVVNGRLLGNTAITLIMNTITPPAP